MSEIKRPQVLIEMENGDRITVELYPEYAPISCDNFLSLVRKGFYDGLTFHRIIKGFMVQGGDPLGNGTGGPGYTIKGEFAQNGVDNPLKHERGVLSMARSMDPDSAGSQFFLMTDPAPHLDGQYAAFGKAAGEESFQAIDHIVNTPTPRSIAMAGGDIRSLKDEKGNPIRVHQGNADMPLKPCRIKKASILCE